MDVNQRKKRREVTNAILYRGDKGDSPLYLTETAYYFFLRSKLNEQGWGESEQSKEPKVLLLKFS